MHYFVKKTGELKAIDVSPKRLTPTMMKLIGAERGITYREAVREFGLREVKAVKFIKLLKNAMQGEALEKAFENYDPNEPEEVGNAA